MNDIAQLVADPQVAARNMLVAVEEHRAPRGRQSRQALGVRGSRRSAPAPPALDEGRARILAELEAADRG